jgi:cell division topological specificity factor
MLEFFDRLFGRDGDRAKSGKIAKDRLQFVLVQDRISLPANKLQEMKQEIIQVISKYVAVDLENVDFALTNRERTGLLIAEIPFSAVPLNDPTSDKALDGEARYMGEDEDDEDTLDP